MTTVPLWGVRKNGLTTIDDVLEMTVVLAVVAVGVFVVFGLIDWTIFGPIEGLFDWFGTFTGVWFWSDDGITEASGIADASGCNGPDRSSSEKRFPISKSGSFWLGVVCCGT